MQYDKEVWPAKLHLLFAFSPSSFLKSIRMNNRFTTLLLLLSVCCGCCAADWMARLDDSRRVCRVSIPGTHDACTGYGFLPEDTLLGNKIARTQELNISQQWAAGVRAFDLRPDVRNMGDTTRVLQVYHGAFATRQTFAGVFDVLRDSLRQHPTEFAVIIMQHERNDGRDGSRWEQMADYVLAMNSDLLVDFRPDLTVGQMRGRILVLSRDRYNSLPRGGYVEGWRFDSDVDWHNPAVIKGCAQKGRLVVQDFYNMTWEGGTPAKLAAIQRLLHLANSKKVADADPDMWFVNHTSGYSITTSDFTPQPVSTSDGYRANAAETNRWLANLIEARESTVKSRTKNNRPTRQRHVHTGLVMMDFAGVDRSGSYDVLGKRLVNAVIDSNF